MNTDKQYKYINIKLYKEFFRQLSILSLIFLGILMLFTVFIPVNSMIDISSTAATSKTVVNILGSFFYFAFIFTIYVPVLVLYAFNFLTKRNACDYYHSFPHTRTCLYLTISASVISWILIVLLSNTVVSILIYAIFSKYFILNIGRLLLFSLSILICSLLVMASIILACTITGTTFTNVAVSGLIIFLPRILITLFCAIATSACEIFVSDKLFPLFYSNMNIVFDTVLSVFINSRPSFFDAAPLIYTSVLAVIYFAAAGFLFVRRKSETAGTPASGRKTQCIIRIAIALPVTLFAIPVIFHKIIGVANLGGSEIFNIIIVYIIAVLVMFIYEFVSSRKIRNVVRALPSVGILVITNIIIIAGLYIVDITQLNYTPSGESIDYITLPQDESIYSSPTYFERILGEYKITEPALVNFVSDKLAETVKHCKNDNAYNNFYRDDYSVITVGIKSGAFIKYRNLCVPNEEYELFYNILYSNEEIRQIFTNLPEYDRYSSLIEITDPIDEKKSEELYNSLRDELKSVEPASWAELVRLQDSPVSIIFQTIIDDVKTYTSMPLSKLTPKTLQLYINTVNSSVTKEDADKIAKTIDAIDQNNGNNEDMEYEIDIDVLSDDFKSIQSYCYIDSDNNGEEPLEIYEINEPGSTIPNYSDDEYDEDYDDEGETLVAIVDDYTEIIGFIKDCFSNPPAIESLDSAGYTLLAIHYSGYDYSSYSYDDYDEVYNYSGNTDNTVYVPVESDKLEQYIASHAAE